MKVSGAIQGRRLLTFLPGSVIQCSLLTGLQGWGKPFLITHTHSLSPLLSLSAPQCLRLSLCLIHLPISVSPSLFFCLPLSLSLCFSFPISIFFLCLCLSPYLSLCVSPHLFLFSLPPVILCECQSSPGMTDPCPSTPCSVPVGLILHRGTE